MKKTLTLIIALMMVLSMAACSDKASDEVTNETEDKVLIDAEVEVEEESSDETEEVVEEETSDEAEKKPETDKNSSDKDKPSKEENNSDNTAVDKNDKPAEKPTEKPQEPAPEVKPENNEKLSVGNTLLKEFKKVAGSANASGVAEKLASSSVVSEIGLTTMDVEPGFLTGFDNAEIKGFKEGTMFAPMIGTIPFVGYVFTLEDGVDANEFISTLKSSANLRWNICTTAEEMVAGSSGNKVFFVMCNKSFEE